LQVQSQPPQLQPQPPQQPQPNNIEPNTFGTSSIQDIVPETTPKKNDNIKSRADEMERSRNSLLSNMFQQNRNLGIKPGGPTSDTMISNIKHT
jgi:hypothetical protein